MKKCLYLRLFIGKSPLLAVAAICTQLLNQTSITNHKICHYV